MKLRRLVQCCVIVSLAFFSGCASTFKMLEPPYMNFSSSTIVDSVAVAYRFDILRESGNKKYAKKEQRSNIKLIAVKIANNTKRTIVFRDNVKIYDGTKLVAPIEENVAYQGLKQSPPAYFVYLVLSPVHMLSVNISGNSSTFPFGFILGPALALENVLVASSANAKFRRGLKKYYLLDRRIEPNETAFGMLALDMEGFTNLEFKIDKLILPAIP